LNSLQRNLPDGLVVDAAWLEQRGYSRGLRSKYVTTGWLDKVARGVYRRPSARLAPSDKVRLRWEVVVISLQTLLECPLAVGERTAIELQGFGHYLAATGPREVHLYGAVTPPGWLQKLKLTSRFVVHNSQRLFVAHAPEALANTQPLPEGLTRQPWGHEEWPLIMSTPERAILELLDEVPKHETFHQADVLMEGLRNLSPRRLHRLLVDCRSVKVKRLFFWFAERHNHAWLRGLERSGIDLGGGKRMLVRGGKLDTKYNITVPESLDAGV
jgi:hypothetical protein